MCFKFCVASLSPFGNVHMGGKGEPGEYTILLGIATQFQRELHSACFAIL